jgi:chromosome segregation ATPase
MPKRAASSPAKHASSPAKQVTKKARVEQKPATPEALVIATLVAADHLPKQCRDIFQASLPFCFSTACADRHKFQLEVLSNAQKVLDDMEAEKRSKVSEEENQLASVQTEKDATIAEREAKAASAEGKKKECDEKSGQVDEATKAVEAAADAVKAAQNRKEECLDKKNKLSADLADFQTLLSTSYQPLKDGSFPGREWQKRNKMVTEFLKKLGAATKIEASLMEAMEVLFKTRPDQRETFAKTTLEFVEKALDDHTQSISQQIPALDDQAAAHEKEIEADEAVLSEKKSQKESVEKEWDEAQKEWVEMDTEACKARSKVQTIELKVEEVQAEVNLAKQALEEFLNVSAAFAQLKEPVKAAPEVAPVDENIIEERAEAIHVEEPLQVA